MSERETASYESEAFDFLPHLQGHPNHLMQNGGGLVGGNQQQQQQQVPRANGNGTTTKKKKGQGPGRRPALDANKCQHKAEEQANNANRQQLNLMGGAHNMYQNPHHHLQNSSSTSSFNSSHHFHRLVDDIERFHAIAELEQLDDDSLDDDGSI
ncbi:hypothetical protein CAEBREN_30583 [Caenorhabditis brenneri]|uniref:Uncharacterized protein n=1 Tax=Caenorhabditis brenneri TaxID=135651 RepID=G0MZT2_CAEBE|nr:hypothetical protein CAEBREN_30583 [Caenorhabditis brenneri]